MEEDIPTIIPVTDLQKQWKVLTFHEDRLNRIDEYVKKNNENSVSTTVDNSVLNNEVQQLSLVQNTMAKNQQDFISSQQNVMNNIQTRTRGDIERMQSQYNDLNKSLTNYIQNLTERIDELNVTVSNIKNTSMSETTD